MACLLSLWVTGCCCNKVAKGGKLEPLELGHFGAFIVTIFLFSCLITTSGVEP